MIFYKDIIWRLYIDKSITIKEIFWKNDYKKVIGIINNLDKFWLEIGIEKLSKENLDHFYNNIYVPFINTKSHPNVIDLPKRIKELEEKWKIFYIWYVKKDWDIIWWIIFFNRLSNWYKIVWASFRWIKKNESNLDIPIWNLLEYLFFSECIKLWADILSKWKSSNCIWSLVWSWIWVALHKLKQKFLPYTLSDNQLIEIDESKINKDTLIFLDPDENGKYTKAIIYTKNDIIETKKFYWLIEKRWIKLEVKNI